jgi:hypothetical protein
MLSLVLATSMPQGTQSRPVSAGQSGFDKLVDHILSEEISNRDFVTHSRACDIDTYMCRALKAEKTAQEKLCTVRTVVQQTPVPWCARRTLQIEKK